MSDNLKYLSGALHMHTDLSHDGSMPVEELASFLKSKKYDFICITEHSYDIDDAAMSVLADKSKSLSSPDFMIVPGIEFRCHHDIDIMGFGVIETCGSESPSEVIDHIHNHGGVAVLAHPSHKDYPFEKEWLEKLDGAEIWNQIHDSRYMPEIHSIDRFDHLRKSCPDLRVFCGLDLHNEKSFFFMTAEIAVKENNRSEILAALRAGSFKSRSRFFNIGARDKINLFYYLYISLFNSLVKIVRWLRDLISNEKSV